MKIEFTIYSTPVAQPRHQTKVLTDAEGKVLRGANNRAKVLEFIPSDHQIHHFKFLVREEARRVMAIQGLDPFLGGIPLVTQVQFFLSRPAWANQKIGRKGAKRLKYSPGPLCHTGRPDLDNLIKGVKDALKGIIWKDDSQVVSYGPDHGKWYHEIHGEARTVVQIWSIDLVPSFESTAQVTTWENDTFDWRYGKE